MSNIPNSTFSTILAVEIILRPWRPSSTRSKSPDGTCSPRGLCVLLCECEFDSLVPSQKFHKVPEQPAALTDHFLTLS